MAEVGNTTAISYYNCNKSLYWLVFVVLFITYTFEKINTMKNRKCELILMLEK